MSMKMWIIIAVVVILLAVGGYVVYTKTKKPAEVKTDTGKAPLLPTPAEKTTTTTPAAQ